MKLQEKVIYHGLDDDQFMIINEMIWLGEANQIVFKGKVFQIDMDTETVIEVGERELNVGFEVNGIYSKDDL